jgi:hypothetical protein
MCRTSCLLTDTVLTRQPDALPWSTPWKTMLDVAKWQTGTRATRTSKSRSGDMSRPDGRRRAVSGPTQRVRGSSPWWRTAWAPCLTWAFAAKEDHGIGLRVDHWVRATLSR